jgi:6-phosphogluconolactonase
LTPVTGSPFAAGHNPVSVAVEPTGKYPYVANGNDNNVSAYSIAAKEL